jgi:hypothetical protein
MFEIFYIHHGDVHNFSVETRATLCSMLSLLMKDRGVKAVKVFIKGTIGWYQCVDLYVDLGLGFKDWEAFRQGSFYACDWEV